MVVALPNSFNCGYLHEIGLISVLAGMEESSPGMSPGGAIGRHWLLRHGSHFSSAGVATDISPILSN